MNDNTKIMPRDPGSNGAVDLFSPDARVRAIDLSPREPHLYDYLLILRKHQWLILSFLLAIVTIVSIATFRMRPVYIATARIEIDRENANILPFQGRFVRLHDGSGKLHRNAIQDSYQRDHGPADYPQQRPRL